MPSRNVELKARLPSLATARDVARRLATARLDDQHQRDTYFHAPEGRLKLREISAGAAFRAAPETAWPLPAGNFGSVPPPSPPAGETYSQLIWYARPDAVAAKTSQYVIVPIIDAQACRQALAAALGIRGVVEKHREIYLVDNVRVHLDRVENLGTFLELEAVLQPDHDERRGEEQVAWLRREFDLRDEDLLAGSYLELLSLV